MRLKIILEDSENGNFTMKLSPDMRQIAAMWKDGNRSPSLVYGIHCINKIFNMAEEAKKKNSENQLIIPDSIYKAMGRFV